MKITINGVEYRFHLTGTVGLMYLAERTLGAAFNPEDKYHTLVLYYCCLVASNPGKSVPDVMEFIASLTSSTLSEISGFFWKEWERIEGPSNPEEETAQGED
jgi:hypothetical protein